MNNNTIKIIALVLLLQGISAFLLWRQQPRTAWVNIQALYKDFDYKKELESKLQNTTELRKHIIDSMEMELRVLQSQLKAQKKIDQELFNLFEIKRAAYAEKSKLFEEDNAMMVKKYDEQILTQLNQYVKDYGSQEGYQYIYGAEGSGALMYASSGEDITEPLKVYINQRYKGKQ